MIADNAEHHRSASGMPSLEEVMNYFSAQDFPLEEGEVFYFYYQGLGWKTETGGPLRNWKHAASRWLWNLEH
jgi:hypothetical protein